MSARRLRAAAVAVGLAGTVAACGSSAASHTTPTTTAAPRTAASAYSMAQVLGWVTPTLQNGASLVSILPAGSTDAQVLASATQLGVACGIARQELGQTVWTGAAHAAEAALAATVTRLQALITSPPASGLGAALTPEVATMQQDLSALARTLPG